MVKTFDTFDLKVSTLKIDKKSFVLVHRFCSTRQMKKCPQNEKIIKLEVQSNLGLRNG